jgi:hypothetical protein
MKQEKGVVMSFMKTFRFKIRFDEEFQDYYFKPFKNREEYVWINDIMETNKGLLAITEYGDIPVKEIDWKNMLVICEVK